MGRELPEQHDVGGRELIPAVAENVERADGPLLVDQRHHELRRHPRDEVDVSRIVLDVVDEQRHLAEDRGADESLARLQPNRDVALRVADRVRDAHVGAALVEQVDGEGVELDEPCDERRNLREKVVHVEHGGHLAAEVDERREHLLLTMLCLRKHLLLAFDYTGNFMEDLTLPLDHATIERILPHRYPLLLVDRITELEMDKRIVGIKNVTLNERNLARRDGERPVLPPTILTEAIAQVGAILILAKPENRQRLPFFAGIERVRYRRPVHPGDVVVIEAVVKRLRSRMGVLHGIARVDGLVAVEGTMTFALGPPRGASIAQ